MATPLAPDPAYAALELDLRNAAISSLTPIGLLLYYREDTRHPIHVVFQIPETISPNPVPHSTLAPAPDARWFRILEASLTCGHTPLGIVALDSSHALRTILWADTATRLGYPRETVEQIALDTCRGLQGHTAPLPGPIS